jgi:hypothetical protein
MQTARAFHATFHSVFLFEETVKQFETAAAKPGSNFYE